MQISFEWLKDYIRIDADLQKLTDLLTFSGIEVENVIHYGDLPESIITARVLETDMVKDSDHLMVCQVDTGSETVQVVCGAPNCKKDMVGVLALPGTRIGDITLKKTKIRGVESSGMLCSEKELGLSDDHSGIIILPSDTAVGVPVRDLFKLPDTLFELEITPNRPDLLGYLGVATDLAAIIDESVTTPNTDNIIDLEDDGSPIANNLILKNFEPDLCPRYVARVIKNVTVTESPVWLKLRLLKSGLRPINNIVDITNYIMLETGHPLHAFDFDKLETESGKAIIKVRRAADKEEFPALDGKTYILDTDNLVIADAAKPVALAGVIGGMNSHITDTTRNIVLEAACFNHSSIRRTAYGHKISTDSSYRFERHLASETAEYASCRATELILRLAGGKLCQGSLDDWQNKQNNHVVRLRPARFKQVIGLGLAKEEIIKYLSRLGLTYLGEGSKETDLSEAGIIIPEIVKDGEQTLYYKKSASDQKDLSVIDQIQEALYFQIPPKRVDLTREIDLIEEVIRLHGMDKVDRAQPRSLIMDRHAFSIRRKISDFMTHNGFQEIVNLSFTDPDFIKSLKLSESDARLDQIGLLNPQNSNLSVMRSTLLPQLLKTAVYNLNHDVRDLKLFELNKVFLENRSLPKLERYRLSILYSGKNHIEHWKSKAVETGFYEVKGLVNGILQFTGLTETDHKDPVSGYLVNVEAQSIYVKESCVAEFGKLNPEIAAQFGLDTVELKQEIWLADIDVSTIIELTRNINPVYQQVPRFPSVQRDLSFLIKTGVSYTEIKLCIEQSAGSTMLSLVLIDEYKGKQVPEGFRSLTFRFVFNDAEKTLTDDKVDTLIEKIIQELTQRWNIQVR